MVLRDPLLITDLDRRSYLEVPEVARSAADGARRDGSSQGVCYVGLVEWSTGPGAAVTIGATAAQELALGLPSRLPFPAPTSSPGSLLGEGATPGRSCRGSS